MSKIVGEYLKNYIGLNPDNISSDIIERAVKTRMEVNNIKHLKDYESLLLSNSEELENIIEYLVVPETWFFRDKGPYELLKSLAIERVQKGLNGVQLKILSFPCSTGEEPYSIVITLLNAGFSKEQFIVHAADISSYALRVAKLGIYTKNSFREQSFIPDKEYFEIMDGKYHLKNNIKSAVKFSQQNILNSELLNKTNYYDIIFCRNVLIYFDNESKNKTIDRLVNALKPNGILFTGHAETPLFTSKLKSIKYEHSFALIKQNIQFENIKVIPDKKSTLPNLTFEKKQTFSKTNPSVQKNTKEIIKVDLTSTSMTKEEMIHIASKKADEGDFKKAEFYCNEFVKKYGHNADVYFILGIISQARGESYEAEKLFLKTLYLNPLHRDALTYLSLLMESKGNLEQAAIYRERAVKSLKANV